MKFLIPVVIGSASGDSLIPLIAEPGSVVGYDGDGNLQISPSLDLLANSVSAGDVESSGQVQSYALSVQNADRTAGVTADETGVMVSDLTMRTLQLFVGPDFITVGSTRLSEDLINALVSANPSVDNPVIAERDVRLRDTRPSYAHDWDSHFGMVSSADQVSIDPTGYTGNLAGITGGAPSLKDALVLVDGLAVSGSPAASAVAVSTNNFGSHLTSDENTVQKALDKIDDLTIPAAVTSLAASAITANVTNFNGNLTSDDTSVQHALDTMDNLVVGA